MMQSQVTPTMKEYQRLAAKGTHVPIYCEVPADLETPVSAFMKLTKQSQSAFLLESVEYGEKIGRYSFIGFDPLLTITSQNGQLHMQQAQKSRQRLSQDLLSTLKNQLQQYQVVDLPQLPQFIGGLVGYVGYEQVVDFEDIQLKAKDHARMPGAVFFLTETVVIFDHIEHHLKIATLVKGRNAQGASQSAYRNGVRRIQSIYRKLQRPLSVSTGRKSASHKPLRIRSNETKRRFEDKVRRIKEYIRAGDTIQVVLSQRFQLGRLPNPFAVYRALRSLNPSPYMFYFLHNDLTLIGSSPEVLVKKTGRVAEVRPIAGTRRRGKTEAEDLALEKELKHDAKELAEHLMLVDLGRNDLGRVCQYREIQVKHYARIERYSHVMHLVSDIVGLLQRGKDAFDLLRATFPAGTVTGAPKIRAMEIINELEMVERGPYAGCLGYFSFSGDMDMCITIRTIIVHQGAAYVQAGAGIVNDSIPRREYQETVNKAQALIRAVELARHIS